jgi:hypothetical protein
MNTFEFLQEMAQEIPYERRTVKGMIQRQKAAAELLERERAWWLEGLEKEIR